MTVWERVEYVFDQTRKLTLNLLAVSASILVVGSIATDVVGGSYQVDPIEIAAGLDKKLPSPDGVAAQLRDQIGLDWRKVYFNSPVNPIVKETDEPAVDIGGTSFPLLYVATLLRQFIGAPIVRVSGQVIAVAPDASSGAAAADAAPDLSRVRVTLRITGSDSGPYFDKTGPYDDVMADAAITTLAEIDPYAAAAALSQGTRSDQQRGYKLVRSALEQTEAAVAAAARRFWRRAPTDLPRGYLTEATVLLSLQRYPESEAFFEKAAVEYQRHDSLRKRWYAADDGLATLHLVTGDYEKARAAAQTALDDRHNYDSALYHLAEVDDEESRAFFSGRIPGDYCAAEKHFQLARDNYLAFAKDHSSFSVVYTQQAIMAFLRLNWTRHKDTIAVACPDAATPDSIPDQITATQNAFDTAIVEDDRNPMSWFQSANLLFERQDPIYLFSETDRAKRSVLLEEAIRRYKSAIALKSDDFYMWDRYGQALAAAAALSGPNEAGHPISEVVAAYCKSIALNRNDATYLSITQAALKALPGTPSTCP